MVNNRVRLTAAARTPRRKLLACSVLAALACLGATSGASVSLGATTPVKIMPLGDSITDGYTIPGGYRIDLEDDLVARGVSFDFVGSLSNGPASLGDRDHEGHSGWRIDELRAHIDGWIAASQPDVVLLLIGSNDVAQNYQVDTAPDRLAGLIDRIHELRPATKLFVSSIPMSTNTAYHSAAQTYNAEIPGIVDARAAAGRPIWFVNGGGALTLSDMAEGSHPNAAGYSKLADAWFAALVPTLALPSVSLTVPTNGAVFAPGDDVGLAASASDDQGVERVEFLVGGTKVGEDVQAPYEWLWVDPAAGTYSITARAVDTGGAAATSPPISITIDAPAGQSAFYRAINLGGGALTLDGRAWEATTAPNVRTADLNYENQSVPLIPPTDEARATMIRSVVWGWTQTQVSLLAVPAGTYDVYATVWEDNKSATFDVRLEGAVVRAGYQSGSAGSWARLGPFRATIGDGAIDLTAGPDAGISGIEVWRVGTATSSPPSVSLTAPSPGQVFASVDDVRLTASASDADGVQRVEFFAGSTRLGEDPSAPYEWLWVNPPAGVHSLSARAVDVGGAEATSTGVSITVLADAAPQASSQNVVTSAGLSIEITLLGSDGETCELGYSIATTPSQGALGAVTNEPCTTGSPNQDRARVTYTPAPGYSGPDSFTYRVSDGSSSSAAATVALTVEPAAGDPVAIHVGDLDGGVTVTGKTWTAAVVVTALDGRNARVAGVTVAGAWASRGNGSCVTASDGRCTLTLSGIAKSVKLVTFAVVQLSKTTFRYEPGANSDPDGDSTGTSITVTRG